jgi:hypothetical protein
MADVACASDVSVEAEFCAQEGSAQLRNKFLSRVAPRAEPVLEIPIKARFMARPMRQFMKGHVVEVVRALEPREGRHRNEILLGTCGSCGCRVGAAGWRFASQVLKNLEKVIDGAIGKAVPYPDSNHIIQPRVF